MKDQIDLLIEENKALEKELFPEYFTTVSSTVEEDISEEV